MLSPADSPPHRYDKRMAAGETRLELARRRVREAEQRVEVQRELVRELTRKRLATHDAEEREGPTFSDESISAALL